jgi:23S rRNA pseudouridine1911/1915/1917 synthase
VKVNNNIVNKNIKIFNKDEINLDILIEKLDEIKPEKMNFDVIFEDKQLIILNKDAGINVHPVP